MDYGKVLERSFEITRKYRALWLFGILLAIFGAGGFKGNIWNMGSRPGTAGGAPGYPEIPPSIAGYLVAILAALLCIGLAWLVLSILLRFISRGALIGLVDELEANGTKPQVGRGFAIGRDRFWPLLGIGLVVNVPLGIVSLGLLFLAALPALGSILPMLNAGRVPGEIGREVTGGMAGSLMLLCCVVILLWIAALVIHPFYQFFVRECVVHKRGVFDSIREGYRTVRANLGAIAVLYVLMIGLGLLYALAFLVIAGILLGIAAGAGFLVGLAASSATPGIIVGVVVGIPALLFLLFVSGLYQVFDSTVWTEGFLQLNKATPTAADQTASPAA